MTKRRVIGVGLAAVCALVASSLWYSPLLFGRQFAELSGVTSSSQPSGLRVVAELLRNVLLASVIRWLLPSIQASRGFKGMIRLAIALWLGFPFVLLSGSVLWQNVPLQLGLLHCGDWLIKSLLTTLILWFMGRREMEARTHQEAVVRSQLLPISSRA